MAGRISVSRFLAALTDAVTATQGPAGAAQWLVKDDYAAHAADHRTLTASTDTTVTLAAGTRMVRVTNWDTTNRVLVKFGAITSDTDSTAARVGIAAAANVPGSEVYPIAATSVHVRSAGASEVTIEAFG